MSLDAIIAAHNRDVFVREFTYSSSLFKSTNGQQYELCDGAVWIGELLVLIQNKERDPKSDSRDPAKETAWFDKKVLKTAVDQLADSLRFLKDENTLPLANLRNQVIDLATAKEKVSLTHLVVLYLPSKALPANVLMKKGRVSKRIGFVHVLHAAEYARMCRTLHTPFEISDYLTFRKDIVLRDQASAERVSEKALLGQLAAFSRWC